MSIRSKTGSSYPGVDTAILILPIVTSRTGSSMDPHNLLPKYGSFRCALIGAGGDTGVITAQMLTASSIQSSSLDMINSFLRHSCLGTEAISLLSSWRWPDG